MFKKTRIVTLYSIGNFSRLVCGVLRRAAQGMDKRDRFDFHDLIRSYFALGGQQVQVTVANADDLKAATEEPEKWRHLIVRVGGYSDYFTPEQNRTIDSLVRERLHPDYGYS